MRDIATEDREKQLDLQIPSVIQVEKEELWSPNLRSVF